MNVTQKYTKVSFSSAGRALLLGVVGAGVGALSGVLSTVLFKDAPLLHNVAIGAASGVLAFSWRSASKQNEFRENVVFPAIMASMPPCVEPSSLSSLIFMAGVNTVIANVLIPLFDRTFPHGPEDKPLNKCGNPSLQPS
ncbi:MAG: hypothetical protein AB7E52_01800 [Bdellovibrionales bacterium]